MLMQPTHSMAMNCSSDCDNALQLMVVGAQAACSCRLGGYGGWVRQAGDVMVEQKGQQGHSNSSSRARHGSNATWSEWSLQEEAVLCCAWWWKGATAAAAAAAAAAEAAALHQLDVSS
jgi:hypothetical protein